VDYEETVHDADNEDAYNVAVVVDKERDEDDELAYDVNSRLY